MASLILDIPAQQAKGGVPLSPMLGQYQVNVAAFCKEFNSSSVNYLEGLPIRCKVTILSEGQYRFTYGGVKMSFLLNLALFEINKNKSREKRVPFLFDMLRIFCLLSGKDEKKFSSVFWSYLGTYKRKI